MLNQISYASKLVSAALVGLLLLTPAAHSSHVASYGVGGGKVTTIELRLCTSNVLVEVVGDDKSDLDFVIKSQQGDILHEDADETSVMAYTVQKASGCRVYKLVVRNVGDAYSSFVVSLTDQG